MDKNNYSCPDVFFLRVLVLGGWIVLLACGLCMAQKSGLDTVEAKFARYRANDLQEKLFVHTDKAFYLAGELLWFKLYDINGASNTPFRFSGVAYVELLDKNNVPVLQCKVPMAGYHGCGSLYLPFTLHSGNYLLRAYTSWMKNFSPQCYFQKALMIINTTRSSDFPPHRDSLQYDIQFFPEGGNLVSGLPAEVGFRVTDQYGNGIDCEGTLMDEDSDDTLLHFRPLKFGIGHFFFTPVRADHYKAVIRLPAGRILTRALPAAYEKGYAMHVQDTTGNRISILLHTNIPAEKFVYLIIHNREAVKVAEVLIVRNGEASCMIDRDSLGEGIAQFTVFNSEQQPVCERLYFNGVSKKLIIQVKANEQYAARSKVSLQLEAQDESGRPAMADMSVSVYRVDSLQPADQHNIFSWLWLSSDLTGKVECPWYYFQQGGDTAAQALDNLMLTQGWRRFSWKNVLQQSLLSFHNAPELNGPVISGTITDDRTGVTSKGTLVYLSVPGKEGRLYGSQSDDKGVIHFAMKGFYGPHQIVVETNTQGRDSADQIDIANPYSEKYADYALPRFMISRNLQDQLRFHHLWMQVQQVYYGNKLNGFKAIPGDSVAFYGKASKIYMLDDYTRFTTLEEVIREYVQEVVIGRRNRHYHFSVKDALFNFDASSTSAFFQDDPLVLLDGVPFFDADKLLSFDPLKIQRLEVVAGRYFFGPVVADGVVSFTTYKGDLGGFQLDPHAVVLDYDGLQRGRKFYSPVYETEEQLSSPVPDFRNVLYWSPELKSDTQGKSQVSFYTSDIAGNYVVIVNGITPDGRAGNSVSFFNVGK